MVNTEPLAERVLGLIREHYPVSGKHRLVVAVSGGQDSVCLLHILVGLREKLDIELHVAHLNHQLRGADSEADAQYVSHLAQQLGVPATIGQRDVRAYQARQRISLEEAAREVRYTFLTQVAMSVGADRVAVGHTTDDQVETILMHLIRGTGTRGLRGLQPSSQWRSSGGSLTIIRPLLGVSRQETAVYCHDHQLVPRVDITNLSLLPLRNKIRLQLLPLLQSYNPQVAEALLRTARMAGDELAFLDRESARLWSGIAQREADAIALDKEAFLELPPALQRHLLRMAVEELLGSLKDIEGRHVEEIMAALTKPAGRRLNLPGGLVFVIEYRRYLLGLGSAPLSPLPALDNEVTLKIPGQTLFPGWRVSATIVEPPVAKGKPKGALVPPKTAALPRQGNGMKETGLLEDNFMAHFDFNKVGSEMVVRCRRPGDRFQPLGMSQPKKIGEFMIDAKIPRAWRQRIPIVCSSEHIIWVVGGRIDDRVKVTVSTTQVLSLEFER